MSARHGIAVAACETPDLLQLCVYYKGAIEDAVSLGLNPYQDGACRLIAWQIAFAGNGDLSFRPYYEEVHRMCVDQVEKDQLEIEEKEIEPVYKAS